MGEKDDTISPDKKFEYVIIVQIFRNYRPKKILELNFEQFLKHKKWHSTMRAWNLRITKDLLNDAKVIFDDTKKKDENNYKIKIK